MQRNSYEYYFYAALFGLLAVASIILLFATEKSAGGDMIGSWRLLAQLARGVNPYDYIGASELPEVLKDIGTSDYSYNVTPWGLIIGNIYYFGFLELHTAIKCFLTLYAVSFALLLICLYFKAKEIYEDKGFILFLLLLTIGSPNFTVGIHARNVSGIFGCLLLIAWIICDDHPIITGIILGIVMTKPQEGGLICFAFLLQKRFLPLIIGAVIDIAAWFYMSVLTGRGMIELIQEFFSRFSVAGGENRNSGLFTLAFENPTIATICSMITGMILVIAFLRYYSAYRKSDVPEEFSLCFAYMFSPIWCYSTNSAHFILLLPAIVCLYLMMRSEKIYQRLFWFGSSLYLMCGETFRSKQLFAFIMGYRPEKYTRELIASCYDVGLIILALIILFSLTSRKQKN